MKVGGLRFSMFSDERSARAWLICISCGIPSALGRPSISAARKTGAARTRWLKVLDFSVILPFSAELNA